MVVVLGRVVDVVDEDDVDDADVVEDADVAPFRVVVVDDGALSFGAVEEVVGGGRVVVVVVEAGSRQAGTLSGKVRPKTTTVIGWSPSSEQTIVQRALPRPSVV